MKLYFVRHGESEANVLRVISNRDLPHPLTEKGKTQAATLAQKLAAANVRKIYASPILRARQTGEILARALHVPLELAAALREPDCGIAEGRGDETAWEWHRQIMQTWLIEENFDARIQDGESFNETRARFVPFVQQVVAQNQNGDGDVALIAHGGIFLLLLPLVMINVDRAAVWNYPLPNTAYALAETTPHGLRCLEWFGVPMI